MKVFYFILFILFSLHVNAHDYYFAFAEVSYNDISKKVELTITVSTHDFELAIEKEKNYNIELETLKDSVQLADVESYLLNHFSIANDKTIKLNLIGHKTLLNGVTNFYFESNAIVLSKAITFSFDLLMDEFKDQQNKLTFYYRGNTYTRPFLFDKRKQTIELIKKQL